MNPIKRVCILIALPLVLGTVGLHAQTAEPPQPAQTPPTTHTTPDGLVDALNGVFGAHPDYRAMYAKGIVLEGIFTPNPAAASITKAANFQKTPLPLMIRFSDFSGAPNISDADPSASPHGMAIKFYFPDDTEADIVANSYNGFPVATPDAFLAFLTALGASGPNVPKPTPLDKFLADHPSAAAYMKGQNPPPVSFATEPYFGVNTFKFTNAAGDVTYGRYQIRPVADTAFLSAENAARAEPNYLISEIIQRVHKAPVRFKLLLQLAEKGDDITNPSIAWPDSRKTVELGTIEIERSLGDSDIAQRRFVFLPTVMPDGIEPADPMIEMRARAEISSFSRRSQ